MKNIDICNEEAAYQLRKCGSEDTGNFLNFASPKVRKHISGTYFLFLITALNSKNVSEY